MPTQEWAELGSGAELDSVIGERRILYLKSAAEPVYAVAHAAPTVPAGSHGVVMCPSFGWSDYCMYRAKRNWADALSAAGHPTVRFDLPGTGESGGSVRDPDQPRAWIDAVATAAKWLRSELGCAHVTGFGIGLGGMIAWLAAAEDAPIDDLMLWATPTSGRRLLREAQAGAKMTMDSVLRFESEDEARICGSAPEIGADLLDEAGQITARATIDWLSAVDLTQAPLPDPGRRRALVYVRDEDGPEAAVISCLREMGVDVTEADGNGYQELMRYVQQSRVPDAAVEASIRWLTARPSGPAALASPADWGHDFAADVLETSHDGVAIRERPIRVTVNGAVMSAIVCEPVTATGVDVCAVFFSGGSDRRLGPNRLWVEMSRRWAARGLCAVRVDPPGIGDSDGDERCWDDLHSHYAEELPRWTVSFLDDLVAHGLPDRFVLTGFCATAYRSLHVARLDRRVRGVFAVGLPFFFWTWWTVNIRDWWTVDWVPRSTDGWKKVTAVRGIQRAIAVMSYARRVMMRPTRRRPDRAERALAQAASDAEILIMFRGGSHELRDLIADRRISRLRAIPRVELLRIPGNDVRFRPLQLQHYVTSALDRALTRVLDAESTAGVSGEVASGLPHHQ